MTPTAKPQTYFSLYDLAERWRCSRGTVYNRLRAARVQVVDFALPGQRGQKLVPARAVEQIETRHLRQMR